MKRKFLVIIVLIVLPVMVFAETQWFDISVGLSMFKKVREVSTSFEFSDLVDLDSYDYKAEIRNKLLFFEFDMVGSPSITSNGSFQFEGLFLYGFTDDIFDFARISFCVGPDFTYINDGTKSEIIVQGNVIETNSLIDLLCASTYTFRAGIDFILGPVMKIGLAYTLPTEFSLNSGDLNLLVPSYENLKEGKISLSILMTLV
ncbi:MAG: hypothetical protein WC162_04935 [Sphaerochaetaceae bacterium]|nr:hypothetical protein [Sphaerochaetaceae bacterium]